MLDKKKGIYVPDLSKYYAIFFGIENQRLANGGLFCSIILYRSLREDLWKKSCFFFFQQEADGPPFWHKGKEGKNVYSEIDVYKKQKDEELSRPPKKKIREELNKKLAQHIMLGGYRVVIKNVPKLLIFFF